MTMKKYNPTFKQMLDIEEYPLPETDEGIITYSPILGWALNQAFICKQHIAHDKETLDLSRITHWLPLKKL